MAKQFDNSFGRFAQTSSSGLHNVLKVAVLIVLLVGFGLSIASQNWLILGVFAAAFFGTLLFTGLGYVQTRKSIAAAGETRIEWEAALPEIQRQNLTLEVNELSKILEVETGQVGDLQSAFIVAEDLALRQIQQEEQVPLMRHVNVGGVPFDAVFVNNDVLVCAEVSFLVAPELRQDRLDAIMLKIGLVKESIEATNIEMQVRLMLILITQLTEEELDRLRKTLGTGRFGATPVDIDIRLLDFEELQRIYVTD